MKPYQLEFAWRGFEPHEIPIIRRKGFDTLEGLIAYVYEMEHDRNSHIPWYKTYEVKEIFV